MRSGRTFRVAALLAAMCTTSAIQAAEPEGGPRWSPPESVDQLIVRYKKDPGEAQLRTRMEVASRAGAARGLSIKHGRRGALGTHVLKLGKGLEVRDALALARELVSSDPNIEYAEPDYVAVAQLVPDDPSYASLQWHYQQNNGGIHAPLAWDQATGTGVVVGVLDTGYLPHPDLAANLLPGYDFISDASRARDGNGRDASALDEGNWQPMFHCNEVAPRNSNWHGLHVAGTIGALTNNSVGVAGVAFNARILPVRVLGLCGGHTSDIADAIVWASGGTVAGVPANANPARVLNLSLGSLTPSACGATYQNAINSARSRNTVVVISAGNQNTYADHSPGNCHGVITVAATNASGGRASYSNYGPAVEIAAPGGDGGSSVYSLWNSGTTTPAGHTYGPLMGTSMAAPHVAGVAALMLQRNPSLKPDEVSSLIQFGARSFPVSCPGCGAGIVQAATAVNYAISPPVPTLNVPDMEVVGLNEWGVASSTFVIDPTGDIYISAPNGPTLTPYGPWLNPKVGMTNYQVRSVSNTGCAGPGTSWVSLTYGAAWTISTPDGTPNQYASCNFYLQMRLASDPTTILVHANITLTAYTGLGF